MSVTARFVSGSVASWTQIAFGMAGQIVLVPVYLMYWNVKTYGIWLAIQAIVSLFVLGGFWASAIHRIRVSANWYK